MDSVPLYQIRGFTLLGFRDMAAFLDYLYLGKNLKTGTLVAINAEKVLTAESQPAIRQLIEEAEFKYADGISIVRSVRKNIRRRKSPALPVPICGKD